MAADEVQWLKLKDLDALLERAKAEAWTELALLAGGAAVRVANTLVRIDWPAAQVCVLSEPLQQLPAVFVEVDSLSSLFLWGHEIGDAGADAIASMSNLTSLTLVGNQIGEAGAVAIARLPKLTSLDLKLNQIGEAGAKAIARLSDLTSLKLDGNQIGDEGAEAISRLSNLISLDLMVNNIGDKGAEAISRLSKLTSLNLNGNEIGHAGAVAIVRLSNLNSLLLADNKIGEKGARAILDSWADRTTAERRRVLDLSSNGDLGGLLPAEMLEGADAQVQLAAWRRFREAEAKGELRPLNEAKVLVLGNEAVGKSSLVRYLVDRLPRNDSEPKTAGIVIRRDVPIVGWSAEESAVRLHFWDFGGQEIMHQTHRYFLTRRSLYLVVLEDRREDDRSVYDWLKVIRSRGGESPVLVVINKCDAGAPNLRLDETGIRVAYPNVVGFVAVSCSEGSDDRIAALRQEIAALVAGDQRLKHVRDPFPPEQLRVKQAVAAAAEEARYLERTAFVRLCETADAPELRITDPDQQRFLLQLMHDLGTVVAHGLERGPSDAAREVTLLDPNWLTEAIYRLLNSKRILDQGGAFGRADMAAELDPARYPPERHSYIIDMMQESEIGLCFRLPGQGERWLIPECLPTVGPDVEAFFADALRFRFAYDFLPAGLVPRFIVEAYNKFTGQPTRWRTGALLAAAGCNVLVRADLDKSRIDLAVTGPEPRRRSALEAVLHDLEAVHKLNPEIGTEGRVPLPDNPEVDVGYEHLLALEADEGAAHSFRPEKAKRKYTVGELLAGVGVEGEQREGNKREAASIKSPQSDASKSLVGGWADHNLWALGSGFVVGLAVGLAAWALGLPPLLCVTIGLISAVGIALYVRSRNPDNVVERLLGTFGAFFGVTLLYQAMGPRFEITLPDALGGGAIAIGQSQSHGPLVIWFAAFALLLIGYLFLRWLKHQSRG